MADGWGVGTGVGCGEGMAVGWGVGTADGCGDGNGPEQEGQDNELIK